MLQPAMPETGYAIVVQPQADRWLWALMDLDAVVTASGTADNRDSAGSAARWPQRPLPRCIAVIAAASDR